MLANIGTAQYLTFALICILALYYFLRLILRPILVNHKTGFAQAVTFIVITWLSLQLMLAYKGFFLASYDMPPRILASIAPWLVVMVMTILMVWNRNYLRELSLTTMTYINVFRLPLELIVFTGLASAGYIPEVMTFHQNNFDILVGISAPIIAYLYFNRRSISWKFLLSWNIVSLLLLINVTFIAILATPYPFQQIGFEQPNIAVLHFPFILLPTLLVPIAYFCHIVSIIKLIRYPENRIETKAKQIGMDSV